MAKSIVITNETIEQIGEEEPVSDEVITILARMIIPEILEYAERIENETSN